MDLEKLTSLMAILCCLLFASIPNAGATIDISPSQLDVLEKAIHLGKFKVAVIQKEIEGLNRNVIIVGETHKVTKMRHDLSLQLVDQFNLIGIEGIDASLMPENFSPDLNYAYDLGGVFSPSKVGSYPGPIMLTKTRFYSELESKSEAEKYLYPWMTAFEFNYLNFMAQFSGDRPVAVASLKENFKEALLILPGVTNEDIITPERMDSLIIEIRKKFVGDSGLDLVKLEYYDSQPSELNSYAECLHRRIPVMKALMSYADTVTSSEILPKILPQLAATCLYSSAIFATSAAYLYMEGYFDRILPKTHQLATEEQIADKLSLKRDKIMSKNIDKALKLRSAAKTMLVLVGEDHVPGIVNILTAQFKFHPASL